MLNNGETKRFKTARLACKAIQLFLVLLTALFLFLIWAPELYNSEGARLINSGRPGISPGSILISNSENGISLLEMPISLRIWLTFRVIILSMLVLWILSLIRSVLENVTAYHSFFSTNVSLFKQIALAGWIIAAVAMFNFEITRDVWNVNIGIPFGAILFAAGMRLLASIFKEGKELKDDQNQII